MSKKFLSMENTELVNKLGQLYGKDETIIKNNLDRYQHLVDKFAERFELNDNEIRFFSAPGRTEIAGNHVDHQLGHVIAASVDLDIVAACQARDDYKIQFISEAYNIVETIDLNDLEPQKHEIGKTPALIRGVAHAFNKKGYKIGGFNCYSTSKVAAGSGISSSAAFEILIATIFNYMYNSGKISPIEQALASQFAENVFFDKPSGLLDQTACAFGEVIAIDFADKNNPKIKQIDLDLGDYGYEMVITKTDKGHSNLTHEYASIPNDMQAIAKFFSKTYLSEVNPNEFFQAVPELSKKFPQRAVLRAIHFFTEEDRTAEQLSALENKNFKRFLDLVNASAHSSEVQLQNVLIPGNNQEQEAALALALSRKFFEDNNLEGACRIHGGGFGGTIQAYVPSEAVEAYVKTLEASFGKDACMIIHIRPVGGIEL